MIRHRLIKFWFFSAITVPVAEQAIAAEKRWTLLSAAPLSSGADTACRAVAEAINKVASGHIKILFKHITEYRKDRAARPPNPRTGTPRTGNPQAADPFAAGRAVLRQVQKGRAVMGCVEAAHYVALLPESAVVTTSNAAPEYARANGGMAMLDRMHRRVLGIKYLGWIDSGIRNHLFLPYRPTFDARGLPVLTRLTVALGPIDRPFVETLGARTLLVARQHRVQAVVQRKASAIVGRATGVIASRLHYRLRYRLMPGFSQNDLGLLANFRGWRGIKPWVRKIVVREIAAFERARRQVRIREVIIEAQTMRRHGMAPIVVPAPRRFLQQVDAATFRYLAKLVRKQGRSVAFLRRLRRGFRR